MTSIHSDRANGDSYFTVEELERIKTLLDFVARRSNSEDCNEIAELRIKCTKEIEYIKSVKSK